jgi:hypothetical protein
MAMPETTPARARRAGGFRNKESVMNASNRKTGGRDPRTGTYLGMTAYDRADSGMRVRFSS